MTIFKIFVIIFLSLLNHDSENIQVDNKLFHNYSSDLLVLNTSNDILNLNNTYISYCKSNNSSLYYDGDLIINLTGVNTIDSKCDYGINVTGKLTIKGNGSLKIIGRLNKENNELSDYVGISANEVVIESGNIDISNYGVGIKTNSLIVNGGTINTNSNRDGLQFSGFEMNGGTINTYGVLSGTDMGYSGKRFFKLNSGTYKSSGDTYGFRTDITLNVNDGYFESVGNEYGIDLGLHGFFSVNGGKFKVIGNNSYGIYRGSVLLSNTEGSIYGGIRAYSKIFSDYQFSDLYVMSGHSEVDAVKSNNYNMSYIFVSKTTSDIGKVMVNDVALNSNISTINYSYDYNNNILTINNLSLNKCSSSSVGYNILSNESLTLKIIGNNVLDSNCNNIVYVNGDLNVIGDGTLTINNYITSGFDVKGSISISDSPKIYSSSGKPLFELDGILNVEGGILSASNSDINSVSGYINNGEVSFRNLISNNEIVFNGGTHNIKNITSSKIEVNDGSVVSEKIDYKVPLKNNDYGSFYLHGGNVNSNNLYTTNMYVDGGSIKSHIVASELNLRGGKVVGRGDYGLNINNIIMSDGELISSGDSVGLKGSLNQTGGLTKIYGGKYGVAGSSYYSPSSKIDGYNRGGDVIVFGGSFEASGGISGIYVNNFGARNCNIKITGNERYGVDSNYFELTNILGEVYGVSSAFYVYGGVSDVSKINILVGNDKDNLKPDSSCLVHKYVKFIENKTIDLNNDNSVDIVDVKLLLLETFKEHDDIDYSYMDINHDNEIDIVDVKLLLLETFE